MAASKRRSKAYNTSLKVHKYVEIIDLTDEGDASRHVHQHHTESPHLALPYISLESARNEAIKPQESEKNDFKTQLKAEKAESKRCHQELERAAVEISDLRNEVTDTKKRIDELLQCAALPKTLDEEKKVVSASEEGLANATHRREAEEFKRQHKEALDEVQRARKREKTLHSSLKRAMIRSGELERQLRQVSAEFDAERTKAQEEVTAVCADVAYYRRKEAKYDGFETHYMRIEVENMKEVERLQNLVNENQARVARAESVIKELRGKLQEPHHYDRLGSERSRRRRSRSRSRCRGQSPRRRY